MKCRRRVPGGSVSAWPIQIQSGQESAWGAASAVGAQWPPFFKFFDPASVHDVHVIIVKKVRSGQGGPGGV
jgi:hypothetical protein